jgi:hypothetical protein
MASNAGNISGSAVVLAFQENTMKKTPSLPVAVLALTLAACAPAVTAESMSTVVIEQATTPPPTMDAPEPAASTAYANSSFGLAFEYPAAWFGPEEYVSGDTLRVEVGSDVVYPYGERPEQAPGAANSYDVVVQFTRHNQNPYYLDTYRLLSTLQDGQAVSGTRSLVTRVRALAIGPMTGFEYLTTLSETAQTQHFLIREVIVVDEQSGDLLDVIGQPVNVEVPSGTGWREAYQAVDEANLAAFRGLLDSIAIQ